MKGFFYVSLSDMMQSIRKNLWKIPHDIDFIIGIPRSGMIPASVISELINVPLIDLDSFVNGQGPNGGHRLELFRGHKSKKVLVCDDTCFGGRAMKEAKAKLMPFNDSYQFIYCAAYLEGIHQSCLDIWIEDVRQYPKQDIQVIYEWNMFHHYPHIMSRFVFDFDGVLCTEDGRPDDSNEKAYENYIANATPLFLPKVQIGAIVTYRISKYRGVTETWLRNNHVKYGELVMFEADNWRDRNYSGISPELHKANYYKSHDQFLLYIESSDREARKIHELTGKQVFSIEKNVLYG